MLALPLLLAGCLRPPPPADAEISDALLALFAAMDEPDDVLAEATVRVEERVYASVDLDARSSLDRSLSPEPMTRAVADAEVVHPDRDPELALPVAVARVSPFEVGDHRHIQLLADHSVVEPYSPEHYQRTFLAGEGCWLHRDCQALSTFNEVTKTNILLTVYYEFYKEFRWVDLDRGDTGEPRWGFVARSWQEEEFWSESGQSGFLQSFTVEIWLPRDGRGPLDDPETPWTADSTGGGTLRLLSMWSETELSLDVTDDQVAGTARIGIDNTFEAADDWLAEELGG